MTAWRLFPENRDTCTNPAHGLKHGPCTDLRQCVGCGCPIPSMRPPGETYGFHEDDCASPERHYGPCEPGGDGHPVGHVRGYWPGFERDVQAARQRHGTYQPREEMWDL